MRLTTRESPPAKPRYISALLLGDFHRVNSSLPWLSAQSSPSVSLRPVQPTQLGGVAIVSHNDQALVGADVLYAVDTAFARRQDLELGVTPLTWEYGASNSEQQHQCQRLSVTPVTSLTMRARRGRPPLVDHRPVRGRDRRQRIVAEMRVLAACSLGTGHLNPWCHFLTPLDGADTTSS